MAGFGRVAELVADRPSEAMQSKRNGRDEQRNTFRWTMHYMGETSNTADRYSGYSSAIRRTWQAGIGNPAKASQGIAGGDLRRRIFGRDSEGALRERFFLCAPAECDGVALNAAVQDESENEHRRCNEAGVIEKLHRKCRAFSGSVFHCGVTQVASSQVVHLAN